MMKTKMLVLAVLMVAATLAAQAATASQAAPLGADCIDKFSVRGHAYPFDQDGSSYSINVWSNGNKGQGTISLKVGNQKASFRLRQVGNDDGVKTYGFSGKICYRINGRTICDQIGPGWVHGCFDGTNFLIEGERFPVVSAGLFG